MQPPDPIQPAGDEVLFVPLGGVGEIGMNLSLYGHDGWWLMVDLGITFGGERFPDFDVMTPDPAFIERRRERLAGLVLTHAHEDHIGAVPYLWRRLRCPVFATPFTAAVLEERLARAGLSGKVPLTVVGLGGRVRAGPFDVEYVSLTHSIPEPNALVIRTPAGAVYHSGDWKLDDDPTLGRPYDRTRLRQLGREPLLGMVCDSTNAVVPGWSGSEGVLEASLRTLVARRTGRVLVTCFASNIARLGTIARVAEATGRTFGLLGQSMERLVGAARRTGYWPVSLPALASPGELGWMPRGAVLAACTGSQGEARAALTRLAADTQRNLQLDPGDTVIFSSRMIPGNEGPVTRVQDRLRARGVEVITDEDALVHVSRHPAQAELAQLYDWIQPPVLIPVHGTPRHLAANARIAADCHVPRQLVGSNGDVFRLAAGGAEIRGRVPVGRLVLRDGRLEPVPPRVLEQMRALAC